MFPRFFSFPSLSAAPKSRSLPSRCPLSPRPFIFFSFPSPPRSGQNIAALMIPRSSRLTRQRAILIRSYIFPRFVLPFISRASYGETRETRFAALIHTLARFLLSSFPFSLPVFLFFLNSLPSRLIPRARQRSLLIALLSRSRYIRPFPLIPQLLRYSPVPPTFLLFASFVRARCHRRRSLSPLETVPRHPLPIHSTSYTP